MNRLANRFRVALFSSMLAGSAMGCSSGNHGAGEEVGADEAALGTALSFNRVSYDLARLAVDGLTAGGTADPDATLSDGTAGLTSWSDTGASEYSLDFATLSAAQRANWSAAIGLGTARIRTTTQEYVVSGGFAAGKLQYVTTVELNGVAVYTCSGDIVEDLGTNTNTSTQCEYTPTTYAATDVYVVRTVATVRALCVAGDSANQAQVQSRLISSAWSNGYTVALWRP